MGVMYLGRYRVKPGRDKEFLEATPKFREHVHRLGGEPAFRIVRMTFAGEMSGAYLSRTEFQDMATLGQYMVARDVDPDVRALMAQGRSADFPAVLAAQHIYQFLYEAGDVSGEQIGNVTWRRIWAVKPGRLDDIVAIGKEAADHAVRIGARSVRIARNVLGASMTGVYASFTRLDSMAALGAYLDKSRSDPVTLSLISRITGEDSPVTPLSQGVGVLVQM